MSDDQLTRLFKYMQSEFGSIRKEIDELRSESRKGISRVCDLLDAHLKNKEIDEQERFAANSQLDRHQGWIVQLVKNTKTKLVPRAE